MTVAEWPRLKPHQLEGLTHLLSRPYSIIAGGTGTGKTGILAHAARYIADKGERVLLLVPNTLMQQTLEEFVLWHGEGWADQHVVQLHNQTQARRVELLRMFRRVPEPVVIIASHEMLSYHGISNALYALEWGAVFVDEATRFRNNSQRTRALIRLHERARVRSVFSGTLVVRNRADLWYPLRFLQPGFFDGIRSKRTFLAQFFTLGGYTGWEPIDERPDQRQHLTDLVNRITWRVNLSDIRDMPERTLTRRVVTLRGEQRVAYTTLRDTLLLEIQRATNEDFRLQVRHYVTRILRLQEISAGFARNTEGDIVRLPSAKTEELLEVLEDGEPTIVWIWFIPEREAVIDRLRAAGYRVTEQRGEFLSGDAEVLVMNPASGGYGLNLDRATRMIYHSLPFDLDLYIQSQERNWRMTTTQPKEIVHLIAEETIDIHIRQRLLAKARISERMGRSDALALLQ